MLNKLQLGSGNTVLEGWINTDLNPLREPIKKMDVTKSFPFKDNFFDYIFHEHFIEHLPYASGYFMLRECHRVMRKNGKMRICTPSLSALLSLYNKDLTNIQKKYINWIKHRFLDEWLKDSSGVVIENIQVYVINNNFYNWSHKFIYDESLLIGVLRRVGFVDINKCEVGVSTDPNLTGLETHGIMNHEEDLNKYESMVYEARKR